MVNIDQLHCKSATVTQHRRAASLENDIYSYKVKAVGKHT
jgi:hypothetical protein